MGNTQPKDAETSEIEITAPKKREDINLKALPYDAKFAVYRMWRALPITMLRKLTRDQIYARVGIDDEYVLDLCEIKTQTEFGEIYDVHIDTLTDWNVRIRKENPLDEARAWAQMLVKNLIFTLYSKAVRSGDPFQIELFFKAVNKWEEKAKVTVDYHGVTQFNIQQITPEKIKEMYTPKVEESSIIETQPNGTEIGSVNLMGHDEQATRSVPVS